MRTHWLTVVAAAPMALAACRWENTSSASSGETPLLFTLKRVGGVSSVLTSCGRRLCRWMVDRRPLLLNTDALVHCWFSSGCGPDFFGDVRLRGGAAVPAPSVAACAW